MIQIGINIAVKGLAIISSLFNFRVTESGDNRITENGDKRITE
tara:strand:+ start:221 stop:349 length:129 start_codon:yes stop_codon:yes gene_type:complete